MTGKPFSKTRTITSERLISPLAGRRDLNDAAIAFKDAVRESITRPTLNAGLSVKALDNATGSETYKDTDGKKRTSKGGTPGMVELPNGYNYVPSQKWEEGKVLQLFPSIKSRKTAVKKPNFGWVDEPRSVTADEYARALAAKPKLRIRKYKVNKKTDEIIEETEQTLDPFSLNGNKTVSSSGYNEKRLPGQTIGQRGRSLIARAASAFGIIVDENGKFRCPPGTPAANQFTDNAGTNCFGISASEIFDFAKRMASGIDVSKETGVKHTTTKLFEFLSWLDNGAIPGIGRTVWRDENGKRIKNIKKWREVRKTESGRVFVDGMIRAQDKLAQQDINIASLMDTLGVIRTDEKRKTNDDVFEVFQKLRDSGAWTIDTSTRLSKEDVDKIVKARLAHVPGFSGLSPERQKSLIEADTERWYTTERALLESALDSFIADPEHMRTIAKINFQVKSPDDPEMDEASTSGITTPDTKRLMTVINVDIPEIMNNQEAMIPSLAPGERMRIDFVGGKTDSERATALTDFLVTVDGHSKQLAAMVEERAFARHIMKHEIAHTVQFQGFAREAERQIRTNGFITVLNDKGEPVKVENVKDLNSGMVFSLMKNASDGIDLESLKNALSRADVVGFLAGDYPKMYFNDEYGADYWALEATAELWALRDLGIIYGDDIDAALEWMDDVSDGRYMDIRRRSDAEGLRDIEARYYENLGPDPELTGNSIAEVKERLDLAHKKELSLIEDWSEDSSTTSDDFVDALSGLEYNREAYNDAYDNLEATGESKDSPGFKNLNRKIKENNAKIALIEKKWAERFSSEDKDRRRSDVKKMRESVREKMFSEGILRPEEMAARSRQEEIKNLKKQAEDMTEDEFIQKLADIEISLKEPGLSADDKSVLLEDKKMLRAIFKSKLEGSEDSKVWAKQRRELDTRIDEIVNPPRQQALKKTKKVKTDKAGASYAKKIQRDESLAMTEEQAIAVERLGDPELTDIGNLVDPDGNVSAVKNINRRYRRAQRSAGDLSPESETAALEDQIEKVLIPAMEAMDESSIPDDLEIEAEIYFGVTPGGFKDTSTYFDSQGFITGRIITDESPHKPGESRDEDGEVITRAGKEKTRVIVQVSKGDKGLFRTRETVLGDEGALVLPPGKMKIVDTRPDGTMVIRVQEQDNVVDVLDRVSSSIGEEGPGASQHAKGTKKKIDRVTNKYVAQRRENGLSSTPSRPKRDVEIEDKNVEVKRQIISAGGSFGEPPSEDYIAEIGKAPLAQPAEADIKDTSIMYEARTGKKYGLGISNSDLSVDELLNRRAFLYRELLDPEFLHESELISVNEYIYPIRSIDKELAKRGEIVTNLPPPPDFDYPYEPGQKQKLPYQTSIVKVPLVQPAEADIKPDPVDPRTGRTYAKLKGKMTVDELLNRRAGAYQNLLDPDYANDRGGWQGTDRMTLRNVDEELVKRGENISSLPQPLEFDPNHKPGSKKKMPYKTSVGPASDPTTGSEVLGIPQTREQRKVVRATRANMTFEDVKRVMAGESPKEVMSDMSRESLDPAVADFVSRKSVEAILKEIEDAAVEFHAGVDKRPRVRMTESQLTKFADDGEFLPTETDDIVLESGAIGRRLERRLNPATRRSAPKLSSGRQVAGPRQSSLAQASLDKSIERAEKARSRVDGLEKALDALDRTGEWRGGEFGVVLSRGKDKTALDGFDADITPRNLTKEEVEKEGLAKFKQEVEKKLDDSRKELTLQEFLARTKNERLQQGILDIEDVPEEEYRTLVEEGRELRKRSEIDDIEEFKLDGNQEAVIHVGKAQLDGGVLNPSRTSTAGMGSGAAGDTGALNKARIREFNQNFEDNAKKLSIYETTMSALNAGQIKFTPQNREEADAINSLLGISPRYGAKEREEIDLSTLPLLDGMAPLIEDGNRRISELQAKQVRDSNLVARINESPDFGFVSAYPASEPVNTGGYYGRNAAEDVPEDVAKFYTEAQNAARGSSGQNIDIKDRDMWRRWEDNLRGSAFLAIGDSDDTIVRGLGPSNERQVVGVNKPIFGVSSRIESGRQPEDYGYAVQALMARAIRLKREGKEVTPAAVLASRRGKPLDESSFSSGRLSSGARNKVKKRGGLVDRFLLENREVGEEARSLRIDTSSISEPTTIDRDEFFKVVGDVPGVSDTDELLATEKITSSRVSGLEMFRGTYRDEQGEKNRVFGKYVAPNGKEYSITQDSDGIEGVYYVYQGDKRLPESERVAKLTLKLNDGELNVHDIFNVDVNEEERKSGVAQAMVEVAKADFPDASFTTRRVLTADGANFARNLQGPRKGGASGLESSSRLSSGARNKPSKTQRVAGIAGSRATGRVLDAVLKRSGADEDTRERVKYGVNMAGALAAGGPAGFATALAVDVARRAGREIAERGLEEAVQRGKITQNQMDVAMSAVDRVAPNGLPDPVVDKLADAWTIASDFIDERVVTDENKQRLDEFGNIIRAERGELVENAGQVIGSAREKIGKRFGRGKSKPSETDPFGDFDATPTTPSTSISSEYDDPFAGFDENNYKPAKTEFDDFDGVFSSGRRAGRSSDAFRDEYNSRIGISKSTPNSAKPVSGYVVHRSHNEEKKRRVAASGKGNIGSDAIFEIGDTDIVGDGLTALGEIEVILKPEVSDRTSYGRGEALQSAHRPVSMNSSDADDIADALFNADGISSKKQNTEAMLHLLGAKMDKNFSSVGASRDENGKMHPVGMVDSGARAHEPFEAQILGGFKKNEVEGIHYPYSKVSKIAESEDISDVVSQNSMKSKLEKLGFTPEEIAYFYSMSGGKPINTASMTKLKEYRAAKKIKEQYEGMGIGYVKFAHPQGINIENPRSYDKTANQNSRVDEILKKAIDSEIDAELKKTLDGIRKGQQLDLVVD